MTRQRAQLLLMLTAVMWSIGGILIKLVDANPLAIAGVRSTVAAVIFWIAIRKTKDFTWSARQWVTALSVVVTVLLFVVATKLTTAANAILLQYTAPVYAAVLSGPLLGVKPSRKDWTALCFTLLGVMVFFGEGLSKEHRLGNIVAIGSGIGFAAIPLSIHMLRGRSVQESLFLGHVLAALIGLPFLFVGSMPSMGDWGLLLALGVFQLGLPYLLYGIAVPHVTAFEATLIPVLEPILNPVWVALFYGERPSDRAFIGGAIVLGSVLWHSYQSAKASRPDFPL